MDVVDRRKADQKRYQSPHAHVSPHLPHLPHLRSLRSSGLEPRWPGHTPNDLFYTASQREQISVAPKGRIEFDADRKPLWV
ncbi:hypothetical protein AB4Y32_38375 [Paraburkholderia phymatum]|uniref:Uncharacterized protein n=1 Tax=Paraburkholderia phymatum TaxID=148447 RepID=A0ACC6UDH1_9BURK